MRAGRSMFVGLAATLFVMAALGGCTTVTETVKTECDAGSLAAGTPIDVPPPAVPEAGEQGLLDTLALQPASEPLVLGTLLPVTGDLAAFGASMEKAARLAVEQINDAGGVNGHDVELHTADTKTNPAEAPNAFSSLVNQGVMGVAGAASSGVTGSILDLAVDNGVFVFSPASTAPSLTLERDNAGWFARVPPSDALQGQVLANLVYDSGCHSANILAVNNDYGVGLGDVFKSTFESKGGSTGQYVKFDPQGTTFSSQVQQAGNGDPDAIVYIGYPQTGTQIMKEAFEKGVMSDSVFFFSEGVKDESFVENVGKKSGGNPILTGLQGTTPEFATPSGFKQAFMDRWGEEPTLFSAETYDAIVAMALAAAHAGENSPEAIRDSLRTIYNAPGMQVSADDMTEALLQAHAGVDIDYVGVANDFDLDELGDPTGGVYSIWRVESDGSITTVEAGIEV